jgi:L-threonylcarbamoyladenylate synthase
MPCANLRPGPLTLILPRRAERARAAAAGQASIGLRMPAHPVALALLREAARQGVPGVAAPSANRFGRISPTRAAHVVQELGPVLMVLDGGDCDVGIESAIVDCTRKNPTLLRPGQLDAQRIEQVLGRALAAPDAQSPRAPGSLASHYAPMARLRLWDSAALAAALQALAPLQPWGEQRLAVYSRIVLPPWHGVLQRVMPSSASAVAHELFAVLREFDAAGATQIWVENPPSGAAWHGVRDRLQRAAAD